MGDILYGKILSGFGIGFGFGDFPGFGFGRIPKSWIRSTTHTGAKDRKSLNLVSGTFWHSVSLLAAKINLLKVFSTRIVPGTARRANWCVFKEKYIDFTLIFLKL